MLNSLSRSARHNGMMLVTITQQWAEFFRYPELANSVIKGADVKIVVRQDPGELSLLKEKLHLTDAEVETIANLGKDQGKRRDLQCLLITGKVRGTVRLGFAPMDYWICTAEPLVDVPQRLSKIEEVKAKNPNLNHTDACRQAVFYLALKHD